MINMVQMVMAWLGFGKAEGIFYIGGSDILPPPLKGQEEQDALEALEQGSEEAKSLLIERNLRLVVFIARRFENTGVNLEDLISIGTVGLIKAVSTYRRDRNIKLATYASRCIENEILMHIRKISGQKAEVSLDEPINTDYDGNVFYYTEPDPVKTITANDGTGEIRVYYLNEKNGTPASQATAFAIRVFPVPGLPTSRQPLGMRPPTS